MYAGLDNYSLVPRLLQPRYKGYSYTSQVYPSSQHSVPLPCVAGVWGPLYPRRGPWSWELQPTGPIIRRLTRWSIWQGSKVALFGQTSRREQPVRWCRHRSLGCPRESIQVLTATCHAKQVSCGVFLQFNGMFTTSCTCSPVSSVESMFTDSICSAFFCFSGVCTS